MKKEPISKKFKDIRKSSHPTALETPTHVTPLSTKNIKGMSNRKLNKMEKKLTKLCKKYCFR